MNSAETRAVQRYFATLVREVKAMDMLDDLFTCEVIDMDDYQRVTGQLADSDKMRKLLETMLTRKVASVNIFRGFVVALEKINRPDLAEDLLTAYQSEVEAAQISTLDINNSSTASGVSSSTSRSCPAQVAAGEFVFQSGGQEAGMDVADAVNQSAHKRETVQPDNTGSVIQSELSVPGPSHESGKINVSKKDLREAAKSAKGKTGTMVLADRVLKYEMEGVYDGQLKWKIRLVDKLTQKCLENVCEGDRFEEMYNCLVKLLAML